MKKATKLLSLVLALMFVAAAFAGCGNNDAGTNNGGDDANNGGNASNGSDAGRTDVVIATANEPPTLHPYDHNAVAANYMNALTYATLYRANTDTLVPEPWLAESCEPVTDTQWKLVIKSDVKFHNGETVTAEDVKATMDWAKNDYSSLTNIYTSGWSDLEVVDDTTLLINTPNVYSKLLFDLCSMKIVPKSLIDSGNDFNANPVGAGPYKLVKWTLGDNITFEAFEDYFEGAPAIKNMTWRIIPEGSSRTIALEAGEVDYIVEVETNDLARLKESAGISVFEKAGTAFNFMMINNEKFPFNNESFRKALNCAIDKDALVQVALNGAGTGVYTQTPTVLPGCSTENIQSHDMEAAKKYIEESGIDPTTVSFNLICSDDTKRRAGEVIQANLQELGITVNLESMDLATYLSNTADGNYEAAIGGYTSSNMMSFVEGVWHSKSINGSNKTRVNDPEIDRLYDLATTQLDETERLETLEKCTARINEICGQVPMYQVNVVRAYNSNLQGINVSAAGNINWQYVSWAD